MATKYVGGRGGLASVAGDARPERAGPAQAMEFPGCDPVPQLGLYESWGFPEGDAGHPVAEPPAAAPAGPDDPSARRGAFPRVRGEPRVSGMAGGQNPCRAGRDPHEPPNPGRPDPRGPQAGPAGRHDPDDDPQIGRHRRQAHGTGLRAGRAEGIAAQRVLLGRLASRKFDAATAERLAEALAGVDDHGRLAEIGDRIIDCDDGAALLADVLLRRTRAEQPTPFRPTTVGGSGPRRGRR